MASQCSEKFSPSLSHIFPAYSIPINPEVASSTVSPETLARLRCFK